MLTGGRGHRRQLHRRQHAVPRPDALGPGADGLRAEHRRRRSTSRVGDEVDLHWVPDHTLPARRRPGRLATGVEREDASSEPRPGRLAPAPDPADAAGRRRSAAGWSATCCCCPAALWLAAVLRRPDCSAWSAPRSTTRAARSSPATQMTWHVRQLHRRVSQDYCEQFIRSFVYAGHRHGRSASCWATRWPTRSRSRPAAGRTSCWSLVIAPFFTSFLIRTLSWQPILPTRASSCRRPAVPAHPRRRTAGCWPPRSRWSPASPTTSCRSWCCRSTRRLEKIDPRLHRGRRATSTPRRSRRSARSRCRCRCPAWSAGTLLTFIPAAGDYINAELLGNTADSRWSATSSRSLFDGGSLPDGGRAVGDADGGDRGAGAGLLRRAGTEELRLMAASGQLARATT